MRLAKALLGLGDATGAIDAALEALKRNAAAPGAKDFIVKIFETLGPAHPLAVAGRKRLSKVLFR
jgi:putative thioredoxin